MMRLFPVRLAPNSRLRPPRRSARLRLTSLYGGLFLVSGVALLAATYFLFERATAFKTPQLPKVPHAPSTKNLQAALPPFSQALPNLVNAQKTLGKTVGLVYDGNGPPNAERVFPQLTTELQQVQRQLARASHQLAQAVHEVTRAGSVEAAQRATDSHQLLVNSGIALAIVAVLAIVAGWLVAGRMLRPIRTITRTARRISSTSLHERLALAGPKDELKELGDTLDDLFARLEAAFEAQRHFVANASHELRTPLTRERALVQVALGDPSTSDVWRSTAEELLSSNREQEALIEALLTLASSEGGLEHFERVDLADICQTVLARASLDADRLGLHIETEIHTAPLEGDPTLIERLVANLIDNAIGHNVDDGRVQVVTGVREGRAVLSMTNSGPAVPQSEVERLFQPFQRLDGRSARHNNGFGLGLSIVRAIAIAHCAIVTASAREGGGLSVEVTFPSPADPRAAAVRGDGSRAVAVG
jgi:signal transduction histidine kinase